MGVLSLGTPDSSADGSELGFGGPEQVKGGAGMGLRQPSLTASVPKL